MRVFVTGTFDPLHSGHITFLKYASRFGDLYVGIGSDDSVEMYKHEVFYPQDERLYMVRAIRYVKEANINTGSGFMDFEDNIFFKKADIVVVNEDQNSEVKKKFCLNEGKRYIVLRRKVELGLEARSSTEIRWKLRWFLQAMEDPIY